MSSNYDYVLFETGVELPDFDLDGGPSNHEWQTKSFPDDCMRLHRITTDGRLYRAMHSYDGQGYPERAHAGYGVIEEIHEDGTSIDESAMDTFDWYRVRFTGTLRVVGGCETSEHHHYDLSYSMGELDGITRVYPLETTSEA